MIGRRIIVLAATWAVIGASTAKPPATKASPRTHSIAPRKAAPASFLDRFLSGRPGSERGAQGTGWIPQEALPDDPTCLDPTLTQPPEVCARGHGPVGG